jgi:hypothetical protein
MNNASFLMSGYIGFGISPQGSMLDADIFIAGVGSDLSAYSSVTTTLPCEKMFVYS